MFRIMSLALVATLMLGGTALAADLKVGVFNAQAVAMDSDAAKAAKKKLESQFGAEKADLEKQAKALQSKAETLQSQLPSLSAKAKEEKQGEFSRLRRDFDEKSRNFARKVENSEMQIRQSMARQMLEATSNVAKKRDLDLVLDAGAGGIMFATPALDITQDVLSEVNRIWKASGSKFSDAPAGR